MVIGKFLKTISKYVLISGMLMFLLIGCFALPHTSVAEGSDGSSSNCFMPGMTEALCQMNPLEHVAAWQNMFTVLPHQGDFVLLLLALLALALGALYLHRRESNAPPLAIVLESQFLYYKRRIPVISPLQEAFSSGILHSKVF